MPLSAGGFKPEASPSGLSRSELRNAGAFDARGVISVFTKTHLSRGF